MQAEDDPQDLVPILELLHALQICTGENGIELLQDCLISAKMLPDRVGMLLINAIIVQDEIVNEVHHFLLEAHVEGLVELLVAQEARQEVKSLLLTEEAALALEVVSFEPS